MVVVVGLKSCRGVIEWLCVWVRLTGDSETQFSHLML